MAEQFVPGQSPASVGADGAPRSAPKVLPWALLFTLGRIVIAAALVALLWVAGLGSFPGLLFGLLLSMPVSFVLLRPVRDRLTEALLARRESKVALRARLRGTDADDAA